MPIRKASSEENGTGQYPEPQERGLLGPELLKIHKISRRARISAVLLSQTILEAFYGFKKVWFFSLLFPTEFPIRKIQINLG